MSPRGRGWGRLALSWVAALVLAHLGGCVSWHAGELRDVPWPPQMERAVELPKLALDIRFDTSMDHTFESGGVTRILDVAIPTIEQSGLFEVATLAEADYQLAVKVFDEAHPRLALAVISGITLGIFPAVASDDYAIEAVLRDSAGGVVAKREIEESLTTVLQLFMVFGMPFAPPGKASESLWRTLWRDLVTWAAEEVRAAGSGRRLSVSGLALPAFGPGAMIAP